jgi:2-polyprenyl-3-methyl-5-hydroxy-6-metoxy-1,4-benzoquinol methylase
LIRCRLCNAQLSAPKLLLPGMPDSAQNFHSEVDMGRPAIDIAIYQCDGCSLVQLSCPPVAYFKEVIRASLLSTEMVKFRSSQLGEFSKKYNLSGKHVLEVGCGTGEYLSILSSLGMIPSGTEMGKGAIDARKRGFEVIAEYPDSDNQVITGSPFDAFFSFNFMEHWPDPKTVLSAISASLTHDGVGLIEVPNFDMILEKMLLSEFVTDHLSYFTKSTFRMALELSGFEVLELKEVWYRYILSAEVRRRRSLDFSPLVQSLEKTKYDIENFLSSSGEKGTVVWGAGHQALAIIGLASLKSKIRYIVDSAPFKQEKFAPGSHVRVKAPDYLDEDPPSSILIVAAGFSDEVYRQIRLRWNDKFTIGILRENYIQRF